MNCCLSSRTITLENSVFVVVLELGWNGYSFVRYWRSKSNIEILHRPWESCICDRL